MKTRRSCYGGTLALAFLFAWLGISSSAADEPRSSGVTPGAANQRDRVADVGSLAVLYRPSDGPRATGPDFGERDARDAGGSSFAARPVARTRSIQGTTEPGRAPVPIEVALLANSLSDPLLRSASSSSTRTAGLLDGIVDSSGAIAELDGVRADGYSWQGGDSLQNRGRTRRSLGAVGRGGGELHDWAVPDTTLRFGSATGGWANLLSAALVDDEIPLRAPTFVGAVERPLFYVQPPRRTKLYRRLQQLARDKLFQELRRRLKREWRSLYRDSTTMRFERYEETLVRINNVGRDEEDRDLFGAELRTREARDLILRGEEREGEVDIPIFTWGPLTLTDGGDIQFDVGTAADDENTVEDGPELGGGQRRKSLMSSETMGVSTSLNLGFDPMGYQPGQNYVPFLRSYGFDVGVEWVSDVLQRELVTTEFSVEVDKHGEVAGFFNFVIFARD